MKNANFASLLKKYQSAGKLNNTKFTASFIAEHHVEESVPEIPQEPTQEIIAFANIFLKKQAKCGDPEFSSRMLQIAESSDSVEEYVPTKTVKYSGEY